MHFLCKKLVADANFVLRDLKETVRALKAKKAELAQGARQSLLKSYNELITESNKLEFKEG